VSRQEGDTVGATASAVTKAWRDGRFEPVDRVVLGLSTAPADTDSADRLCAAVADATRAREVWLADDAVTAHAGALSGCPGVSLVVGTGVACLVLSVSGEPTILGGHGFLLGDEGGGFWIGRQGLNASLRARDGRGAATALTQAAQRRYGELDALHVRLHDAERPVDAIAQFAPDVLAAAEEGDAVADAIVEDSIGELTTLVRVAADTVGTEDDVIVALGGRLLARDAPLRPRLERAVARAGLPVTLRDPEGSPLDGALRIGAGPSPAPYTRLVHEWPGGVRP
jgi:N-acetylglucosamine kinase-like BadF-type ATPase